MKYRSLIPGLTIFKTISWDVTLIRWYIYLGLYTHEVEWPSDMYYESDRRRSLSNAEELVMIIIIIIIIIMQINYASLQYRLIYHT
jgi:uncharacterized membrane protein YkvI